MKNRLDQLAMVHRVFGKSLAFLSGFWTCPFHCTEKKKDPSTADEISYWQRCGYSHFLNFRE